MHTQCSSSIQRASYIPPGAHIPPYIVGGRPEGLREGMGTTHPHIHISTHPHIQAPLSPHLQRRRVQRHRQQWVQRDIAEAEAVNGGGSTVRKGDGVSALLGVVRDRAALGLCDGGLGMGPSCSGGKWVGIRNRVYCPRCTAPHACRIMPMLGLRRQTKRTYPIPQKLLISTKCSSESHLDSDTPRQLGQAAHLTNAWCSFRGPRLEAVVGTSSTASAATTSAARSSSRRQHSGASSRY